MSNARDLANVGGGGVSVDSGAPDNSLVVNSSGSVGIGASSPAYKLDARLSGTSSGAVIQVGNTGSGGFGGLGVSDGGTYPLQIWGSSLAFLSGNSSYASATERMRIDSAGRVTMPYQPFANGYPSSIQSTSATKATLTVAHTTAGTSFSNSRFTCPVAGLYEVVWNTAVNYYNGTENDLWVYKNGAQMSPSYGSWASANNTWAGLHLQVVIPCAAGDYLELYGRGYTYGNSSWNYFHFRLIG